MVVAFLIIRTVDKVMSDRQSQTDVDEFRAQSSALIERYIRAFCEGSAPFPDPEYKLLLTWEDVSCLLTQRVLELAERHHLLSEGGQEVLKTWYGEAAAI